MIAVQNCTSFDGVTVDWSTSAMSCTCIAARRCKPMKRMCKHIAQVLRERQDITGAYPDQEETIHIPVALPDTASRGVLWQPLILMPVDSSGLREVIWASWGDDRTIGYVNTSTPRLAIRSLLFPYLLEECMDTTCARCGMPEAMANANNPPTVHEQYAIIRAGLAIRQNSKTLCYDCDDSDLIPDV